jgi:hypothetical protein
MGKREWSAWRAAYEAQGQGRYGTALAATEETLAGPPEVAAAARATRGSVLRQVRLHARAEAEDHAGLDLAPGDPALLIGLVADAVGQGTPTDARLAAAWASQPADWRQQVRLAWVTGEVALTHDDRETGAGAFGQALDLARTHDATRHEAKSLLFLGVATDDPVLLGRRWIWRPTAATTRSAGRRCSCSESTRRPSASALRSSTPCPSRCAARPARATPFPRARLGGHAR